MCGLKTSPCVGSKRAHVFNMRAFCRYTRKRFEPTHGDVLNLHTGFFLRAEPRHTHHTPTHTTYHTPTHTPRTQTHTPRTQTHTPRTHTPQNTQTHQHTHSQHTRTTISTHTQTTRHIHIHIHIHTHIHTPHIHECLDTCTIDNRP